MSEQPAKQRHPKYPNCPELAPQVSRGGFLRTTGRALVGLSSWRVIGELPNEPKLIMLAAPHSSNWDGIYGILAACAIGLKATWMGKASLFQKPILGRLMRLFGGIAVDRSNPAGAVGQVAEEFAKRERMWVVLAPEGTRKKVPKWRTGFWHLARAAKVPLFLVYFDYERKEVGCGELFHTTDDLEADMERLYAFYAPWRGKGGKSALPLGRDPESFQKTDSTMDVELADRHSVGAIIEHSSPFHVLEVPAEHAPLPEDIRKSWVMPIYFGLNEAGRRFVEENLQKIGEAPVAQLLASFNWRPRVAGAYYAALTGQLKYGDQIGRLLLRSDVCIAGGAYCVALASFNQSDSIAYLNKYLDYYLAKPDLWFDQNVAMAALAYLDRINDTRYMDAHLPAWQSFVANKPEWNLQRSVVEFDNTMTALNQLKAQYCAQAPQ